MRPVKILLGKKSLDLTDPFRAPNHIETSHHMLVVLGESFILALEMLKMGIVWESYRPRKLCCDEVLDAANFAPKSDEGKLIYNRFVDPLGRL